jgi:hypothetical protein
MAEDKRPLRQQVGSFFTGLTGLLTGIAALIGAIVAILTATGVIGGNSSKPHTKSSKPAPTVQWAARANAICAKANDTTSALPSPRSLAPSDIASYLNTSVELERRMLRELSALPAPAEDGQKVRQFLNIGATMSDATSDLAHDVTLGNIAGAQTRARSLSRLNTRFNEAAVALGARTCAEGSSLGDTFGG